MLPPEAGARRIEKLQFAPESRWEEALSVGGDSSAAPFEAWLAGFRAARLGIEVFFDAAGEGGAPAAFIGMRLAFPEEGRSFAAGLTEAFLARRLSSVNDFLAFAESRLGAPLFAGSPDFMELGLVNLWQSFGPLTFWRAGCGPAEERFKEALAAAPRYLRRLAAAPAIEAGYLLPFPHWFGITAASALADGRYLLDTEAAAAYLKTAAALSR